LHKGNQDENFHGQKHLTKQTLLISKLNIELRKILVRCYVWNIALYNRENWTLRKLERKYLESFEMCC
jgi:hypothetical protein